MLRATMYCYGEKKLKIIDAIVRKFLFHAREFV